MDTDSTSPQDITEGPIASDNSGDTVVLLYCHTVGKACKHHYFHDKHYDYCKAQEGRKDPNAFMTPLRNGWLRLHDEHPNTKCPFLTNSQQGMSNVR